MATTPNPSEIEDGTADGAHGITYEVRMCCYLMLFAIKKQLLGFHIRYQVKHENLDKKLDDIMFCKCKNGKNIYFQLKHGDNDQIIDLVALFGTHPRLKKDFNIINYTNSVANLRKPDSDFKDKIEKAFIFTNRFLKDDKIEIRGNTSQNTNTSNGQNESTIFLIEDDLSDEINEIINFSSYLSNQSYFPSQVKRQKTCLAPDPRLFNFHHDNKIIKKLAEKAKDLSFNLNDDEIEDALSYITYAVGQPNVHCLREIIKEELTNLFNLKGSNLKSAWRDLEGTVRDWCEDKDKIDEKQENEHVVEFKDVMNLLQPHTIKK